MKPSTRRHKRRLRYDRLFIVVGVPVLLVLFIFLIFKALRGIDETVEEIRVEEEKALWSATLSNSDSDLAALRQMDTDIERFIDRWEIAGLSLAVVRNDSLLYAKGYGLASREDSTAMDVSTTMRIASASKLVTAVAIMKLRDEGRLSLDSRVFGPEGILNDPAYTDTITDRRAFDITVDHLLQHTGGFSMRLGDPMFSTADVVAQNGLAKEPTADELIKIVMHRRMATTPGTNYRYSNFGYLLLSQIVEKLTGQPYYKYVSEEVLAPIGAVKFRPGGNTRLERHPDEAVYYGPDTVKVEEYNGSGRMVDRVYGGNDIRGLKGAGGWTTTASDLARLVASIDLDTVVPDILSPESVRLMTQYDEDARIFPRGWADSDGDGHWTRTGTLSSTHVLVERFPDGECWVLSTNSGYYKGYAFAGKMRQLVEQLRARYSGRFPARNLW